MNEQRKLEIAKVHNGYILKGKCDVDGIPFVKVIEEIEEEKGVLAAMEGLLWFVMEYFGVFNSHHDEWMLDVKIKKHPEYSGAWEVEEDGKVIGPSGSEGIPEAPESSASGS